MEATCSLAPTSHAATAAAISTPPSPRPPASKCGSAAQALHLGVPSAHHHCCLIPSPFCLGRHQITSHISASWSPRCGWGKVHNALDHINVVVKSQTMVCVHN
ncbi:hypothetical protein Zm00014a_025196 [Zea mays]|uniref:Uncharacterized protein n=1 Tax=Zea mays TaxID=4577 RepID=A0A3L6E760_MAIZE|nr:hypothetical protein Zm00014a_025196 [Zea mays]